MVEKTKLKESTSKDGRTSLLLAHEDPQKEPKKIAITFKINCKTLIIF